jgi:phosphoglycolate phosphatase-like HAD superfamily hydrolase
MVDCAVIFDVDGVLLELTRAEEELFFQPFEKHCDASKLSRDWNSYQIRNDEDITREICERFNISNPEAIMQNYLSLLSLALTTRHSRASGNPPTVKEIPACAGITAQIIEGAPELLHHLASRATLGIATANFREAAKLRMQNVNLWHHVSACAFGADGGGHKHEILGRALEFLDLPKSHIIYIGDNLNDVAAGLKHGVHFIGFSTSQKRLKDLKQAGAKHISSNHQFTLELIHSLLR